MLWAKIYLALPAVTGVLFALVSVYAFFGMTRPNAKGPITTAEWAMAIGFGLIVLVLHTGYIMAPFAIGKSWHRTALWWMLPLAGIVAIVMLANLRWYIPGLFGARQEGAPMAPGGMKLIFGTVWYILPVALMWATRPPVPAKTAGRVEAVKSGVITSCAESEVVRRASKAWAMFVS